MPYICIVNKLNKKMKRANYYIDFKSTENGETCAYTYPCTSLIYARRLLERMKLALNEEGYFKDYLKKKKSNDFIIQCKSISFSIKDAEESHVIDIQIKHRFQSMEQMTCAKAVSIAINEIKRHEMHINRCKDIVFNLIFMIAIRIYDNSLYVIRDKRFCPLTEGKKHNDEFYNQFTLKVAEQMSKNNVLSKIR